jgi:hypothetical protein
MPNLLAGTIEFVHIEQVSALFMFRLGKVLLYRERERGNERLVGYSHYIFPSAIHYLNKITNNLNGLGSKKTNLAMCRGRLRSQQCLIDILLESVSLWW